MTLHNHHMLSRVPCWADFDREDPYYKVKLTVEGHATQHEILWKVFGQKGDFYASQGLKGMVSKADILRGLPHSRGMLGKTHSVETKLKMSKSATGRDNSKGRAAATAAVRRPIMVYGVEYDSISAASQATGHCRNYIRKIGVRLP